MSTAAHKPLWPRSQRSERNEFITSSLTSSRLVSERILAWSRSNDRGRLLSMRFHSQWGHESCPVMGWYTQQHQSSTKFQSIEHRRNIDGPFYHEFLLLKLTDGAICRVERTGEGSRADAIRYMGCVAHDLIQWFSEADYALFSVKSPSEPIAEVDFGREFDILDVLAVCYSIQNTKACCTYTLQRYNCYFLCLTILAVLTRRVAGWETNIKTDEWNTSLTVMYDCWNNLSPDQAKEHDILTICAYLEPDNPQRAQFIFDILRKHLGPQAEGFAQCNKAMRQTFWRADLESGLRAGLVESLTAVPGLFEGMGYCSQCLGHAVIAGGNSTQYLVMISAPLFAKNYFKILAEQEARSMARVDELYQNLQRLWRIEHPVSLSKLALSRMEGVLWGTLVAISPAFMFADSDYDRRLYSQMPFRVAMVKQGSTEASCMALDRLEKSKAMQALWSTVDNEVGGSRTVQALDRLASIGELSPSEVSIVLSNQFRKKDFVACLASLAALGLNNMLPSLIEPRQTRIKLILGKPESVRPYVTVDEFQETYIKSRTAAHARRVALHQLAAEKFVIEDMEEAMRQVWNGLPSGFGVVELAPSLEAETTVGGSTD